MAYEQKKTYYFHHLIEKFQIFKLLNKRGLLMIIPEFLDFHFKLLN